MGGGGGYRIPSLDRGVPHPRSGQGGVPHPADGGVAPSKIRRRGYHRVPPVQDWMGTPHPRTGWGTPHPRLDGYPPPPTISKASTCYAAGGVPHVHAGGLSCCHIFLRDLFYRNGASSPGSRYCFPFSKKSSVCLCNLCKISLAFLIGICFKFLHTF